MKLNPKVASGTAVAIALALGGSLAQAATITAVPVNYSQQGQALSGTTAAQTLPVITVQLGADYSVNDNITLAIGGATVGGTTDANLNGGGIACTVVGGPNPPILVSFITRSGNNISLRVTQKTVTNTVAPTPVICTITGVQVTAPSLATVTTITASWSATTAITNIPFDPGAAATLANVVDQFQTTGLAGLNGVIDVNSPSFRNCFFTDDATPGSFNAGTPACAGNEDRLSLSTNNGNVSATGVIGAVTFTGPTATLNSIVATVTGSVGFTHLDTDTTAGCSNAEVNAGVIAAAGGGTLTGPASGCASVIYTAPAQALGTGVLHTLAFGYTGKELRAQGFSATVTYTYTGITGTASETDTVSNAGSWTLNGFSAFVPYMPFDSAANISQILYITNKSTQTGAVTITAYNEAGAACAFQAGNATGGANGVVTKLSDAFVTGIKACYGNAFAGRVSFNVTAPIPGSLAEVYSAYNVNGNRLTVINTSNGRITTGGNSVLGSGL